MNKEQIKCFECDSTENIEHHHVVPRSLGGTRTIPLCSSCHSKVHDRKETTISKLIQTDMDAKRTRSEWLGGHAPYGYAIDADGVKLIPVKSELKHLNYMIRLSNEGLSYREIARRLERRKVPTKQGNCRWWGSTVNKVLTRHAILTNNNSNEKILGS